MEEARNMLIGVGLAHELWEEMMDIACYLVNWSPKLALVDKNLDEAWNSKKTSPKHLIFLGFDAYVHIPKENRSKLDN